MKKFFFLLTVFLLAGSLALHAQARLISFDFVEQQIREILYAFSTYAQVSIIGDDTVTGTANFLVFSMEYAKAKGFSNSYLNTALIDEYVLAAKKTLLYSARIPIINDPSYDAVLIYAFTT